MLEFDQESLRQIMETVKHVSDTAGVAGIVWLVLHYTALIFSGVAFPVASVIIVRYIGKYVVELSTKLKVIPKNVKIDKHFITDDVYQEINIELIRLKRIISPTSVYKTIFSRDVGELRKLINKIEEQKDKNV